MDINSKDLKVLEEKFLIIYDANFRFLEDKIYRKYKKLDAEIVKDMIRNILWMICLKNFNDDIKLDFNSVKKICDEFRFQILSHKLNLWKAIYELNKFKYGNDNLPKGYQASYLAVYFGYLKGKPKLSDLDILLDAVWDACSELEDLEEVL